MKFISYAQNFEDVMLWRALNRFGPGFYLDIGACDPEADSVTKAFYERGWRGINVEPMEAAFSRIRSERPLDINLNCAIGEVSGRCEIYSIDDGNGLSTFSHEFAEKYKSEGRKVEKAEISVATLAEVCNSYAKGEIHFLKVDVEGGEEAVLKGADFKIYRPWIILVEATIPNSMMPSHYGWDHILVEAGYTFVYFDGLNRFYVAAEKLSMLESYFQSPPNVFDDFIRSDHLRAIEEAKKNGEILNSLEALIPSDETPNGSIDCRMRNVQERYVAAMAELAKFEELEAELNRVKIEIRYCHQELFESSRVIGALSKERNNLVIQLRELAHLRQEAAHLRHELDHLRELARQAQDEVHLREGRIISLLNSTSWKVTAPLRRLVTLFKR